MSPRTFPRLVVSVIIGLLFLFPASAGAAPPSVPQKPTTLVSLTFDDGTASQYAVRRMLSSRGMHATFFVNSGLVGSSTWLMSWEQINDLHRDGNEIGGHTLDHVKLPQLTDQEQRRQVCQDRKALEAKGFQPTSFAYPEVAPDAHNERVVRDCGYSSGRSAGGLGPPGPYAESIPPKDPFATRGMGPYSSDPIPLSDLQKMVMGAEDHGGGWAIIVLHEVCDDCHSYAPVTPATLAEFLDWLQPRALHGTCVKTVGEVMSSSGDARCLLPGLPRLDLPAPPPTGQLLPSLAVPRL